MQDTNSAEFDFDEWVKLARDNPEAYEDMRRKMLQEVIDSTSPEVRRRMQGLQWKIDQIRSTSPNPMASCLKISQMMWDSVLGENGLLEHMERLKSPAGQEWDKPKTSAKVIEINTVDHKSK